MEIPNFVRVGTSDEQRALLSSLDFVRLPGGLVQMGTDHPIPCRVEGHRQNELPKRELTIDPFYIARTKVTNQFLEQFLRGHKRPLQALEDMHPAVDVTYGEALAFCERLNRATNMNFRMPNEVEWVSAAAPYGWNFAYQEQNEPPDITQTHVYGDGHENSCVPVLDPRWKPNYVGLDQMGHNAAEMTQGFVYTQNGQYGAETDGAYTIVKGGNWGHCPRRPHVYTRMLFDLADRNPRYGFRLAHDEIK